MTKDRIELITKIVGPIIPLIAIIAGLWQFNAGQEANYKMEFNRKMFERTLTTYDELAKITGEIVMSAEDTLKFDSLRMQFDRLYYTKMVLAENDTVGSLMIDTRNELLDYRNNESDLNKVKRRVLFLMDQIKRSLSEDWRNLE